MANQDPNDGTRQHIEERPSIAQVTKEREGSTVHTYKDGSQRVGHPPFPGKSPLQEAAAMARADSGPSAKPMFIPPGKLTSGEAPAPAGAGVTTKELAAAAAQQMQSDVLSGKDPRTVNPTTASDKPELAGTDGTVKAADLEKGIDLDDPKVLDQVAKQIKPEGNIKATDEQKQAAVTQVIREHKGSLVDEAKPKK